MVLEFSKFVPCEEMETFCFWFCYLLFQYYYYYYYYFWLVYGDVMAINRDGRRDIMTIVQPRTCSVFLPGLALDVDQQHADDDHEEDHQAQTDDGDHQQH